MTSITYQKELFSTFFSDISDIIEAIPTEQCSDLKTSPISVF